MKRLLLVGLFLIGCSVEPDSDCGECGLDVYALELEEVSSDHYVMEYDTGIVRYFLCSSISSAVG